MSNGIAALSSISTNYIRVNLISNQTTLQIYGFRVIIKGKLFVANAISNVAMIVDSKCIDREDRIAQNVSSESHLY